MLSEGKNIKDTRENSQSLIKDSIFILSYTRTNKLITALYMVTDIMDSTEPIRQKLRILGADILSDITTIKFSKSTELPYRTSAKIVEVLSFLNIASTLGMISEMNHSIIKKEFIELKKSIDDSIVNYKPFLGHISLSEYFADTSKDEIIDSVNKDKINPANSLNTMSFYKGHGIGHDYKKSIGVQKGSTLLKALSDRIAPRPIVEKNKKAEYENLKKERRFEIVKALKDIKEGLTITDTKNKINDVRLFSSEKMLQRELVDMVKDNVLKKTGSKRWSRYSLV